MSNTFYTEQQSGNQNIQAAETCVMQTIIEKADVFHVRFFGRVVPYPPVNAVFFNWTCSGFEFVFTGVSAEAEFITGSPDGYIPDTKSRARIGVLIDGSEEISASFLLDNSLCHFTLADQLPYGEHKVKVIKLSEVGYGRIGVTNICVKGTRGAQPTQPFTRKIEFIGDSITCGYGNEAKDGNSDFNTAEENGWEAYASKTARILNAEANILSVSGNGVCHDYGTNTVNLIPELYQFRDKLTEEYLGLPPVRWNYDEYVPDLIVVKLGFNDSRYCDGFDRPDEERTEELKQQRRIEFQDGYVRFISQIRKLNPPSAILCIYDPDTVLNPQIQEAVEQFRRESGDTSIYSYGLPNRAPEDGLGANGHWSLTTHKNMAKKLAVHIAALSLC